MDDDVLSNQGSNETDADESCTTENPSSEILQSEELNNISPPLDNAISSPNTSEEKNSKCIVDTDREDMDTSPIDMTMEQDASPEDLSLKCFKSQTATEDTVVMSEEEAVTDASLESSQLTELIDMADESSSMNRVLAWDPWATLSIMKSEVLSASPTDVQLAPSANDSPRPLTATMSVETTSVNSILKGSLRRANSTCASTTAFSATNNRFEPLPIGDTAIDKHVQWRHEVEVTYYTFDSEGRAVLTTQVEPLHEESEQHARSLQFARANTKGISVVPELEDWLPDLNLNN